jgi:transposase
MRTGRPIKALLVTAEDQAKLELMARRPKTDQRTAQRARIVLACAGGANNQSVAAKLGVTAQTVGTWRERFRTGGLRALGDLPRSGQPRKLTDAKVEAVITRTLETQPANATHWSTRTMAATSGLNQNAIVRIWRAFGLKPHLAENFKLSTDPFLVEKVRDIIGLYLNPPERTRAVVLCVDEKSQVQAPDRSQPVLPMRPGQAERRTHDYYRHGTTSLFAALEVATGRIIGPCQGQHRQQEFVRFLHQIERSVPADLEIHLVLDNYATHKTPKVAAWLKKRPRYHLHFTPTSSSWLNQVERWFAKITEQRIRRGVFKSVDELIAAIAAYIAEHNRSAKPFVWTATANLVFERAERLCTRTNRSPH